MNPEEKIDFADKFMEYYLANGLGSLTKSEIDILVFHLITKRGKYKEKTNYELAALLKLPESRIRTLRLNSALKYEEIDSRAILLRVVTRIIESEQFIEFESGKIEISLEDPVEKRELENYLKERGRFAEYTLNTEVLRITPLMLLELIVANVDEPTEKFNQLIQEHFDNGEEQEQLLENTLTLKQKFNKLRREAMDVETLKALIKGGFGLLTSVL